MNGKRLIIAGLGVIVTAWTCFMLFAMGWYVLQAEDQQTANIEFSRFRIVLPMTSGALFVVFAGYALAIGALAWLWAKADARVIASRTSEPSTSDKSI